MIFPLVLPFDVDYSLEGSIKDIDFLFVGHLNDPRKNLQRLVPTVLKLVFELHLIGNSTPEYNDYLYSLSSSFKSRIFLHGVVDDYLLATYYSRSRVICLPSLYEGVGLSAMEGYCYGCQVSITSIGGPKDYFGSSASYIDNPYSDTSITESLLASYRKSSALCSINHDFISQYSLEGFSSLYYELLANTL